MREILFRARASIQSYDGKVNEGDWVYGAYRPPVPHADYFHRIYDKDGVGYRIDKNTVGQYIGLIDGNGYKVFEGDILDFIDCEKHALVESEFEDNGGHYPGLYYGYYLNENCWFTRIDRGKNYICEKVIGNKYENEELLNEL